MGGLVVQQVLARYAVRAAVLVAPIPAHPAVSSLAAIARRHPLDALRIVVGGSLPLRAEYQFHELDGADADALEVPGVRRTAAGYGADLVEFPGMGHDLMLDARWREPLDAMLTWLPKD